MMTIQHVLIMATFISICFFVLNYKQYSLCKSQIELFSLIKGTHSLITHPRVYFKQKYCPHSPQVKPRIHYNLMEKL
jgi:hypothetical protein